MRRHASTILVCLFCILRPTNALSLANFQLVSPTVVSLGCFVEYNTAISTCKLSDFNNGCSLDCQSALTSKASCVSSACSADSVSSNTLLGIVKHGGILAALCPNIKPSTTTTRPTSTITLVKTFTTTSSSVTIPTTSPGVTVSTNSAAVITTTFPALPTTVQPTVQSTSAKSTSTSQSSSSQIPSTTLSSITSSSTTSSFTISSFTISSESTTSTSSNTNTDTNTTPSTTQTQTQSSSTTSTKTTAATPNSTTTTAAVANNGDGISGGGSPFDIDANSGALACKGGGISGRLLVGLSLVYGGLGMWFFM